MIVCIASLHPAVCVLIDYGPLSHDAHSYYPVLSRQRRASQTIRTLCYKILFLTSTPFDKLIEMNDGVRRYVSHKVISNISEAAISINQIIQYRLLAVHQLRDVSGSVLHNPESIVVMVTRGSPLMRSNAKCLVLDGTGASFLDSSRSSMPRRLRSQR
jgi:hypothetical protein